MTKAPLRVVVTGAAGQISYSLLGLIAKGDVFGEFSFFYLKFCVLFDYEKLSKTVHLTLVVKLRTLSRTGV